MSEMRQIMAHLNDSTQTLTVLTIAVAVADGLGVPIAPVYAVDPPDLGPFVTAEGAAQASEAAQRDVRARREEAARRCAGLLPTTAMEFVFGEALATLVQRSRTTDLLVVSQPAHGEPTGHPLDLTERLVVASACPVLIVPRTMRGRDGALPGAGRRVLVAWSDSRECARAVHDALPLLRRAAAVRLLFVGAESPRVAAARWAMEAHLRRHGIAAKWCPTMLPADTSGVSAGHPGHEVDQSVTQTLLQHAVEQDMDLLVMGAYSRPRTVEWMLGGVTRSMIREMCLPVLMSH